MKSKKRIGIIILGIITFIASIISVFITIVAFIEDARGIDQVLIASGVFLLSAIVGLYVKLTNFGILDESELQKSIYEKKNLKEQIEIAELKNKLKKITE